MVRIKKILCPVDFFPASERAADYAIALARNYDAALLLLHVVTPVLPSAYEFTLDGQMLKVMSNTAKKELQKFAGRAEALRVKVECIVRTGDIDLEIQKVVTEQKVDLIVMGTHGRRGFEKWFLGSVTERLIRRVSVPLLTMSERKSTAVPPAIRRILVTTDFSEGTSDAIEYAFSIAQECQAKVTLLHVLNDISADISGRYRDPLIRSIRHELEALVPEGARDWCEVETRVDNGLPFNRIPKILKKEKIDLLVMNIHGKSMLERAMIGSTAERVVRTAGHPVLLIPPLTAPAKKAKSRKKARAA